MLAASIALDLVALYLLLDQRRIVDEVIAGKFAAIDQLVVNDDRRVLVSRLQIVLLLLTAVFFVRWFSRAYRNLRPLQGGEPRWSPGWAIGAWFVPILSFWRPKQLVNDIWRASSPDYRKGDWDDWRHKDAPAWLSVWWLAWIVGGIADRVSNSIIASADEFSALTRGNSIGLAASGLSILAGVLAARLVLRLTARQNARAAAIAASS